MKNILLLIAGVILLIGQGCEKYLDRQPLSNITVSTFFKTESDVKQFVDGLYPSMVPNWDFISDFSTDLNALNPGRLDWGFSDLSLGSQSTTSGSIDEYWNYAPIRSAYQLLAVLDNVPMPENSRKLYHGSVKYLLAYRYFNMFRAYESVPVVKKVLDPGESDVPKNTKEEVFAEALAQVNDAITNLPSLSPSQRERGRLTKLAAMTLKTDLLLYAASRYKESIPEATYQAAADAGNAALTEANANGYALATSFPNLFIAMYQGSADAQKEIILEYVQIMNVATNAATGWVWRPRHDGVGTAGFLATQELVDMYEDTDGHPINKSTLYDPTHPFKNRDPRLTYTILYPGNTTGYLAGKNENWISNSLDPSPDNRDYMLSTYNARDASVSGYINIKYWDREFVNSGYGSRITYRLAELLLMYAEARNEATGPDASVYAAISRVRSRVNMPAVNSTTHPTKEAVRALIRNERAVELVGEGQRYWDVRRWGIGEQVQNKSFYSMHISKFNPDGSFAGYQGDIYVRTSLTDPAAEQLFTIPSGTEGGRLMTKGVFNSPKYYVWPIPDFAIRASNTGALKQNPLWE